MMHRITLLELKLHVGDKSWPHKAPEWTGSRCAGVLIPSAPVQGCASTCALRPTAAHTPSRTSSTGDHQPAWEAVLRRDMPLLPLIWKHTLVSSLRTIKQLLPPSGSKCSTTNQQIQQDLILSVVTDKWEGPFIRKHCATADICFVLRQVATFCTNPGLNMPPLSYPSRSANPILHPAQFSSQLVAYFFPCLLPLPWTLGLANSEYSMQMESCTRQRQFSNLHRGTPEHCSELTGVPQDIPNFGEKHSDTQHLSDVSQDRCSV